MNIQDLITLHNAGYTKEDIFKILGNEQKPEQSEQKPEQSEQKPEQPEQKPEQPEQKLEQPASDDKIKQLENKLDYVINRFNYMAVQQSSQPQGKEESLDDILASVVRGFQKDEKT